MTSPTQRPLSDKTQHSQQTDIHALGGIQTHNPSKRAATDPLATLLLGNISGYPLIGIVGTLESHSGHLGQDALNS
jgi:hypothetical protein